MVKSQEPKSRGNSRVQMDPLLTSRPSLVLFPRDRTMFSNILYKKMLLMFMSVLVITWIIHEISHNPTKVGTQSPTLTRSCYLCELSPQILSPSLPFPLSSLLLSSIYGVSEGDDTDCHYFFIFPSSLGLFNLSCPSLGHPKWLLERPPTAISLNNDLSLNLGVYAWFSKPSLLLPLSMWWLFLVTNMPYSFSILSDN